MLVSSLQLLRKSKVATIHIPIMNLTNFVFSKSDRPPVPSDTCLNKRFQCYRFNMKIFNPNFFWHIISVFIPLMLRAGVCLNLLKDIYIQHYAKTCYYLYNQDEYSIKLFLFFQENNPFKPWKFQDNDHIKMTWSRFRYSEISIVLGKIFMLSWFFYQNKINKNSLSIFCQILQTFYYVFRNSRNGNLSLNLFGVYNPQTKIKKNYFF